MASGRRDLDAEDGMALIGALLAIMVMGALGVTFVALTTAHSRFTGDNRAYETAIHAAEAGANVVVSRVSGAKGFHTGDAWTLAVGASEAEERAWAVERFQAAKGAITRPATFIDTPGGFAYGIRPCSPCDGAGTPMNVIFAVGEITGPQAPQLRVVKLRFNAGMYMADHAVLTQGHLGIAGNPTVDGSSGNVHSNANLTIGNSPVISGDVTAAGTYSGGTATIGGLSGGGFAPQPIPKISPRAVYEERAPYAGTGAATYDGSWYDLCPDGRAHAPAAPGGAPCTGAALSAAGTPFRGWAPSGTPANLWSLDGNDSFSGVYYVHQANASVSGSLGSGTAPVALSALVEGKPNDNGASGSLFISGKPRMQPRMNDVIALTDRDISVTGNSDLTLYGFLGAHEQILIEGTPRIAGAVVAEDRTDGASSPVHANRISGDAHLTYDGQLAVPLGGLFQQLAWKEL